MSGGIIAFNINALNPRHKQQTLVQYINFYKPTVVLLSETKLKPHTRFSIPNYKIFRCDRLENGGGGTMVIIRNNIRAKQLSIQSNLFETCTVQCQINNQPVIIMAAYIPTDCKAKYSDFHNFFSQFNYSIIIGGDLNSRHTQLGDSTCNRNGNNIFPLHSSGDFKIIHAEHPTCHRSTTGSFIDHFIVSSDLVDVVSDRATNIVKLSDHTGIAIETFFEFSSSHAATLPTKKMYDQADFDAINQEIASRLDEWTSF